jgi:hypothetical protein
MWRIMLRFLSQAQDGVYLDISVRTYCLHDPSALKIKPEYFLGAL